MPSVRGFLRSKPKTDDADGELAESQLVARLAGLFGEMAVDAVDADGHLPAETVSNGATMAHGIMVPAAAVPEHATNGARQPDRPYLGRPPIIVIGEAPIIVRATEPTGAEPVAESSEAPDAFGAAEPVAFEPGGAEPDRIVEPVGVMAQAGDAIGEDPWQLPARLEPSLEPAPATKPVRKRPSRARRVTVARTSVEPAPAAELDMGAVLVAEPEARRAPAVEPEMALVPVTAAVAEVPDEDVATTVEPASELEVGLGEGKAASEPVAAMPAAAAAKRSHKKREIGVAAVARSAAPATPVVRIKPAAKAKPAAALIVKPKPPAKAKPAARPASKAKPAAPARPAVLSAVHCPYCGVLLDPPPIASRKCEECQQRIIVKRIDGRAVYLAGAALPVFTAERRRVANSARLTRERGRWLDLASSAGAPSRAVAQLRIARPTDANVGAARELYLLAVERTVRMAKRDKEWEAAARLRRDESTAIYRAEGSPRPPSAEVVELYRDGIASELRGIAEISRDAQLVAASCCDACRNDDEVVTRIATELRQPRLPHADCPKGLCRCHWDLAARDRTTLLRYLRRRSPSASRASSTETPPAR